MQKEKRLNYLKIVIIAVLLSSLQSCYTRFAKFETLPAEQVITVLDAKGNLVQEIRRTDTIQTSGGETCVWEQGPLGYPYSEFDPSPLQIKWNDQEPGDGVIVKSLHGNHLLTAGYSLFLGNSVSFDLAYGYVVSEFTMANADWENVKTVTDTYQRGMASLSVRY